VFLYLIRRRPQITFRSFLRFHLPVTVRYAGLHPSPPPCYDSLRWVFLHPSVTLRASLSSLTVRPPYQVSFGIHPIRYFRHSMSGVCRLSLLGFPVGPPCRALLGSHSSVSRRLGLPTIPSRPISATHTTTTMTKNTTRCFGMWHFLERQN